jgi:hypothetical protein
MLRLFAVMILLGVFSIGAAQAVTVGDIKAKGGVQLSADDLKQLMPDAKVVSSLATGSTRRWTNNAGGTFVASTDGRSFNAGRTLPASGQGSWHVADNGTYCVNIKWGGLLTEDWCSYFFKTGDKYYAARRLDDSAPASEFEITK